MLVVPGEDSTRLVTQSDHARLARDFLALWRADDLTRHPLREALLRATAEHDCGWQGVDAAPMLDPERGLPHDFRSCPEDQRRLIWSETIERLEAIGAASELLVLRHAGQIHHDRKELADWQGFFNHLQERREALEDESDISPVELDSLYEFLWLADTVSLTACGALPARNLTWRAYRLRLQRGLIEIDPFPFAGSTTLRVACRDLPAKHFRSLETLMEQFLMAHWQSMSVRVETLQRP